MSIPFGEYIRRLRVQKGISQQQMANKLFVDRSTIAKWETGARLPDTPMISRLSTVLDVDAAALLRAMSQPEERLKLMLVDDEQLILSGGMRVLREALPTAEVSGFTSPKEALGFAAGNRVQLAFLDIELGVDSGLDLCRKLLILQPQMNVIFLTSFGQYSLDAWDTGACGFLLKPLSVDSVRRQLDRLHLTGGALP